MSRQTKGFIQKLMLLLPILLTLYVIFDLLIWHHLTTQRGAQFLIVFLGWSILNSISEVLVSFIGLFDFIRYKPQSLTITPLVSIIIPAFNEANIIEKTVRVAALCSYPLKEIIVINDGSEDMTGQLLENLRTQIPNLRVLHQKNLGKADALNHALELARGEFVMTLDADTLLLSDAIEKGLAHFQANPRLGALAGGVLVGNQDCLLADLQAFEYCYTINFMKVGFSSIGMVCIVPGAISLFRSKALNGVSGFQSDTLVEDTDVALAILGAGWENEFEIEMAGYTEVPSSVRDLVAQRVRWYRGFYQISKKYLRILFEEKVSLRFGFIIWFFISYFFFMNHLFFSFVLLLLSYAVTGGSHLVEAFIGLSILHHVFGFIVSKLFFGKTILRPQRIYRILPFTYFYLIGINVICIMSHFEEVLGLPFKWTQVRKLKSTLKTSELTDYAHE